ncbi:MAG: glycoside hydrolase family 38 C-terminal domain-containing protein [Pseudomonadota bacterium]
MGGRWPFTAEQIASRLALIKPLFHRRSAPLAPFRILPLSSAIVDASICSDPSNWAEIEHESYWGSGDLNFVMKSHFIVPHDWNAENLTLHLPLGELGDIFNHPEALVHIDRIPIGSADRHHHTLALDPSFSDGNEHVISLHGWTGLAGWPPDPRSRAKLFMGTPCLVERDPALIAFHAHASAVLDTLSVLHPDTAQHQGLLKALDNAFKILDTRAPLGDALYASVPDAQAALNEGMDKAGEPSHETLFGIGHAHMDIAYLWPISQIRLKNARTCTNVLKLMDQDPEFRFSHSQPQLYAMMEEDYPQIFDEIKDRVAEGRWELIGGMWVEPDMNIPGPEALVQQLVLGRRYFKDRFGDLETPVLWLPDTFGFPAQTPQLMRLAGLKWFVTNKLNWNQKNKVPWATHHWEGLDGTRVLAHILTTPRDVQYLPFPTNYKSDLSAAEIHGTTRDETIPDGIDALPICYGYGDGGGGPSEELLAKARAYRQMPGMPRLKKASVREAMERLEQFSETLQVWRGEHYMEGHRGVYTSQAWIKRANRQAERALHEAEALSAMAGLEADLDEAWRLLCLCQFHDIIAGTAVPEVFEDARRDYARIMKLVEPVAAKAADALRGESPMIANTSPISGPRTVLVPAMDAIQHGQPVDGGTLITFDDLPAYATTPIGYAITPEQPAIARFSENNVTLENAFLRVEILANGQISEIFDKRCSANVVKTGDTANQLHVFEDRPLCWDAWDIDPFFEDRMELIDHDGQLKIIENGPIRASVRLAREWRNSTITQTIRLTAISRRIDFETEVDWHERHTLLKAAFPTTINAPMAEFDIQWGVVERSTTRETSFDAARYEVPAHKWACLRDETSSFAVLNDCKYGYDVRDDTIRITLIKSSTSPDPEADQGRHVFTYSALPLGPDDRAILDHEAYALNTPVRFLPATSTAHATPGAFIHSHAENVIIETLKPGENDRDILLRVFEAHGLATETVIECQQPIANAALTLFDETVLSRLQVDGRRILITIGAYEIMTITVSFLKD